LNKKTKSISGQILKLPPAAKDMLFKILKKLQDGEKINREDVGLLGIKLESLQMVFVAKFFQVSGQTVCNWVLEGCPKNADGSFNLAEVSHWLVNREKAKHDNDFQKKLKEKKMQAEIERMEAQTGKIKEETIPREEYESRFASWASSAEAFWTQVCHAVRHHFVGLIATEQVDVLLHDLGKRFFEKWIGNK
jgi:phage terminase Nu1 subunit (DNA packaging protein)